MATPKETIWLLEPHTAAKHKILEAYLNAWFPIINKISRTINYIDGFAGPGIYSKGEPGSPIIALNVANSHKTELIGKLHFVFIEERKDRVVNLDEEIKKLTLKPNYNVHVINGKFHEVVHEALGNLKKDGKILAPTFVFIDPFGFSGIPAKIIEKFLSIPKVEVFINFAVDSINRFFETKGCEFHINEMFGSDVVLEIMKTSKNRIRDLRDLYQLMLQASAKYVRYFEMRNVDDRPIYYLFFATNNEVGHLKMKCAMWKEGKEGEFKFSDATNPNQIIMFEKDNFGEEVFHLIKEKFGNGKYDVDIIKKFVENETAFLDKHCTQAMNYAEENNLIEVDIVKVDGNKRRKGTFPPGVLITIK